MSEFAVFDEVSAWLAEKRPDAWIDLELGQLEGENDAVPDESIFIEFTDTLWEEQMGGQQQGNALISFRIALFFTQDSYFKSQTREAAITKMKLRDEYHKILQGLYGDCFTPLTRVRSYIERRDDNRRVFVMQYRTVITDNTANNVGLGGMATPDPIPVHNPALIPPVE